MAVRGLSVGAPIRRFVGKELAAGVLIGGLIAARFLPLLSLDVQVCVVGVAVLSLCARCVVGAALAQALAATIVR